MRNPRARRRTGAHNITVNSIAPGYFATEMNTALIEIRSSTTGCASVHRRDGGDASKRWTAGVFLASDEASYVNGHMLAVDGAFTVSA